MGVPPAFEKRWEPGPTPNPADLAGSNWATSDGAGPTDVLVAADNAKMYTGSVGAFGDISTAALGELWILSGYSGNVGESTAIVVNCTVMEYDGRCPVFTVGNGSTIGKLRVHGTTAGVFDMAGGITDELNIASNASVRLRSSATQSSGVILCAGTLTMDQGASLSANDAHFVGGGTNTIGQTGTQLLVVGPGTTVRLTQDATYVTVLVFGTLILDSNEGTSIVNMHIYPGGNVTKSRAEAFLAVSTALYLYDGAKADDSLIEQAAVSGTLIKVSPKV